MSFSRRRTPIAARVVGQSFYGAQTELHLELLDGSATAIVARTFDEDGATLGDQKSLFVEGPVTVYPA